jgi:NAD(P)-dependent dehydrogenase (short-subunit alcohol dehydrogenase family)
VQFNLNDKVVVITGGAGLIGRAFSRTIVENDGIAVVADLDAKAATAVAEEIAIAYPGRVKAASLDITDKESIKSLIDGLQKHYGRIDAIVNNAYPRNRNYGHQLEDVTYEDFCENVDSHLGGYFLVAQQFGIFFRAQGGGDIINMSSIYGVVAPRFEIYAGTPMTMPVEYAAIKSALIHLTKYFAQYFKGSNIRVNSISPGGILAAQPEEFLARYNSFAASKGMLDAQDLQGTLLFLLSDMSKFINGQNIVVDDGWSL